jgi:membrane protein implicated in regulation of membrane protease activity
MAGWVLWVILACAFGVGEMLSGSFFLAPFALGAALAALADAIAGGAVSIAVFVVASLLTLLLVRPIVRSHTRAAVLTAEGQKQAAILRAEGEAQAIVTVFDAIHEGKPDPQLLSYQYLQMLPELARGDANKVFVIPSEFAEAFGGLTKAFASSQATGAGGGSSTEPGANSRGALPS